ncbi:MAG: hypothetical protein KDA25_04310, partial [Phycisphaerales bacterium]|nr:hypothetical protein [Phycisphaerales bacterium]
LDLRDNGGGALPAAIGVGDLFLDGGVIVSIKGRNGDEETFDAHARGTLEDFPMIVLVNGFSASASEIVAGALQDHGRARILGTRTYGKGSVQNVRRLPGNQGTLKMTTAYYYLPSGRSLHKKPGTLDWGVDPDPGFLVKVARRDYVRMLRARQGLEILRPADHLQDPCITRDWIDDTLGDPQLGCALEALQTRLRGEPWPAFSEVDRRTVAVNDEILAMDRQRDALILELQRLDRRLLELSDMDIARPPADLLPPGVDLVDGYIEVRDRDGALVGRYRLTDGDLETALEAAGVVPDTTPTPERSPTP